MNIPVDPVIVKILDVILSSATTHFKESLDIHVLSTRTTFLKVDTVSLSHKTAIIGVSGAVNALIAFSFNDALANHLVQVETANLSLSKTEQASYQFDVIAENVNIMIGHSTHILAKTGELIKLTSPIVLEDGGNLHRPKGAVYASISALTDKGSFDVEFITAVDLPSEKLTLITENT